MALVLAAGLTVGLTLASAGHPARGVAVVPASYQQACAAEPGVCRSGVRGAIPAALTRQLHLSRVAGAACPVTPGTNYAGPYVVGQRYGTGPAWMVLGDRGDPARGVSVLGQPGQPGWLAAENVLLIGKGYQGPLSVRGVRLDGPGEASFGIAETTTFIEPPAPGDANDHDGYRTPPATIWVRTPGCYAFQINGERFTETIVISMTAPANSATG